MRPYHHFLLFFFIYRTSPSEKYYSVLVAARKQPHAALTNKFSTPAPTISVWIQICTPLLAPRKFFSDRFPTSRGELFQLYQAQESLVKGKTGMLKNVFLTWRAWKAAPYDFRVLFVRTYLMQGKVLADDPEPKANPVLTKAQQIQDAQEELNKPPPSVAASQANTIDWKTHDPLTADLFNAGIPNQSGQCRLAQRNHMFLAFALLQLRTMLVDTLMVCHRSLAKEAEAEDVSEFRRVEASFNAYHHAAGAEITTLTEKLEHAAGEDTQGIELQLQHKRKELQIAADKLQASKDAVASKNGPRMAKFYKEFPPEVLQQSLDQTRAGAHDATLCTELHVWKQLPSQYSSKDFNRMYVQGSGVYADSKDIHKSLSDLAEVVGWGEDTAISLMNLAQRDTNHVSVTNRAKHQIAKTFQKYCLKVLFTGHVEEIDGDDSDADEGDEDEGEEVEPRTCEVYTGNMFHSPLQLEKDAFQTDFGESIADLGSSTRVVVLTSPPWGYGLSAFDVQPATHELQVH
jgi:hypothetical protein